MLYIYLSIIENEEDKDLFEAIYLENRDIMFSYAVSILKNHHDAEDAVHNVFWSLAENFSLFSNKVRNETDIKNYLLISVKNKSIDILRQRNNQTKIEEAIKIENEKSVDDDFADVIEKESLYENVLKAINILEDKYRDALYMNLVMELSSKEISKLTGEKRETIRKRIYRGKQQLIKILKSREDSRD